MLQISCRGIYHRGPRKKLIGYIGENIENYWKISAKINLDLNTYENIGQIGNKKNSGEIGNIERNLRYLLHYLKAHRTLNAQIIRVDATQNMPTFDDTRDYAT